MECILRFWGSEEQCIFATLHHPSIGLPLGDITCYIINQISFLQNLVTEKAYSASFTLIAIPDFIRDRNEVVYVKQSILDIVGL